MNPTSNSDSFSPSFITNYVDSQGSNILTDSSSQSNLQDTLPLPQAIHDTSASITQAQYQLPQLPFQTSVTSAQASCENQFLPVHPTDFYYRHGFCHYYI